VKVKSDPFSILPAAKTMCHRSLRSHFVNDALGATFPSADKIYITCKPAKGLLKSQNILKLRHITRAFNELAKLEIEISALFDVNYDDYV
jgi:hypothetical protein